VIRGSCLCGEVQLEIGEAQGPFELCHCSRCRHATGAAFAAGIWVQTEQLSITRGRNRIRSYSLPVRESPPPYTTFFCGTCASPVPNPEPDFQWVEVPAGLLDDDPGVRPDKHLVLGPTAPWHEIADELPRLNRDEIRAYRIALWFGDRKAGDSSDD